MAADISSLGEAACRRFEELGYVHCPNSVPAEDLNAFETTLRGLIRHAATCLPEAERRAFDACRFDDERLLHEGLIRLYQLSPRLEQYVVDAALNSFAFYRVVGNPRIAALAASAIGCPVEELGVVAPFFRVDLPGKYEALARKISLPFHQESSYYRYNVSPDTGIVVWIPLFDCGPEEGALHVCVGSHREGALPHEGVYLIPEEQRHFRTRAPDDIVARFKEVRLSVKRGGLGIQHFHLLHRSGLNTRDNRVRYTILIRFSHLGGVDYRPISWRSEDEKE
ncbi:phytanoyl-CoA dioxygenase family protein [Acanthopleuribacter pedis]|uniref:Phytanoyl-CoA dioxygenase family protein n=1 Tax=Acanthopleuribacter pedis TaxID=442870 RepID=A0A8J7QB50_9BACT|nr:phytanoyl-CoA dioxygenase family protein [Acanthopleuribacter pedis]MBO1320419.1 phytanoyl-CoA dioxygenase family protein [Acanthopleuribacter pedis]